jgi:ADP-ribose pyrophosphatase YjhB (NUDIX family)
MFIKVDLTKKILHLKQICNISPFMDKSYKNPTPTADIIIEITHKDGTFDGRIVLIKRKNPPYGWAIPGGFVDYGESLEDAALREAMEETSLRVSLVRQFHTYSDPKRDDRKHTISTVFIARASGMPIAGDDAAGAGLFSKNDLPVEIAFDHAVILDDYFNKRY